LLFVRFFALGDSLFIVRRFVLVTLLLLANCAAQFDPAKYALADRDTAVRTTFNKRHFAKMHGDYDGRAVRATSDVPKVDIGKSPADDVGRSRVDIREKRITRAEKSDVGFGGQTVPAALRVGQSAESSSAPKDGSFLETLAKDDKENQLLKRKTNICRGC
jgi:hypothetical protein